MQEKILRKIEAVAEQRGLPIIGPVKGKVLTDLMVTRMPMHILEVGTLVGYSAILMGGLLPEGRRITCVEINPKTAETARANIERAGLGDRIQVIVGPALEVIPRLEGPFDMVFLDAAKGEYLGYLKAVEPMLSANAIVAADNVGMFGDQLRDYLHYVRKAGTYKSKTIDFGFDRVEVSEYLGITHPAHILDDARSSKR